LHAQLGGLALEFLEYLFLVRVLIIVRTMIDILTFILEHVIDNPGDFAGGGDNCFGRAVPGAHAAKEGPKAISDWDTCILACLACDRRRLNPFPLVADAPDMASLPHLSRREL